MEKNPKCIDEAIEFMEQHGFVDDKEFAGWFVEQRAAHRPRSPMVLATELRMRGVHEDITRTAMEDYDGDAACLKHLEKRRRLKVRGCARVYVSV